MMKYLALAAALTLTNCTTQQTVQEPIVVEIELPQYKEPLLIVPEPVYKKREKKDRRLNNLVREFVDTSIEVNVQHLKIIDSENFYLVNFDRSNDDFELRMESLKTGDSLQLYGNNFVDDIKVNYIDTIAGPSFNNRYLLTTNTIKIDSQGPLKEKLVEIVKSMDYLSSYLRESSSSGLDEYHRLLDPPFDETFKTISEYVLANH